MCSKVKPLQCHKKAHTHTYAHTVSLTMLLVVQLHGWQPGIKNPYRGMVVWPVPENIDISVTLFKVPEPEPTVYTVHTQAGDKLEERLVNPQLLYIYSGTVVKYKFTVL